MKKSKLNLASYLSRQRCFHLMIGIGLLYLVLMSLEIPLIFLRGVEVTSLNIALPRPFLLETEEDRAKKESPNRPHKDPFRVSQFEVTVSGLIFAEIGKNDSDWDAGFSEFQKSAKEAWEIGRRLWEEIRLDSGAETDEFEKKKKKKKKNDSRIESCPHSISLTGSEFLERGKVVVLPCGLTLGSHITLVGKPYAAHVEHEPKISALKDGAESMLVSQFMMELQGLKTVDEEDPPRILHFNPRLKGDWSGKPVIEQNTCYRMQWGSALRCEGWKSKADEEMVDELVKCENWIRDDDNHSEESKTTWWLNRLIGRTKKVSIDWPYPFAEGKLFVLTLSAGLEGYHVNVDGRHVTSFPYRTGFVLKDATGISLNGDLHVQSIFAASLPTSHPSFAPQRHLEMSSEWKALPLSDGPVELFIGILSAGNHFAERMAVRKSWMRSRLIKSSNVVARFFVALLLTVSAKYIMKCDDDTFVRVESVIKEVKKVPSGRSLYVGNINYYHKPLRYGKWAVTYEEWPEKDYPPYANGPGYVISADIAHFVVSKFEKHTLRLFKMEDVSMGMWVEQFNSSTPIEYLHNLNFCQFGCIKDYYTATLPVTETDNLHVGQVKDGQAPVLRREMMSTMT